MCPVTGESIEVFSMLTLARASSPKIYFAYRLAARKPQLPERDFCGVRHFILVDLIRWFRYSSKSVMPVLTVTLFSHSNSAHICLNWASLQEAGMM